MRWSPKLGFRGRASQTELARNKGGGADFVLKWIPVSIYMYIGKPLGMYVHVDQYIYICMSKRMNMYMYATISLILFSMFVHVSKSEINVHHVRKCLCLCGYTFI